jgi:hypothetical protein
VVAPVVVVIDEGIDLRFEVTGQEVVFQQDAVLQGLVPSLDLALGLGVVWRAADMVHALVRPAIRPVHRRCNWTIVRQQPRLVHHRGLSQPEACRASSSVSVTSSAFIVGAELPGDDVAAVIVEDGRQIEPAPADDLQIGEVGLPELVRRVVLSWNSSAALITTKAGLVIRSCALSSR